MKLTIERTELAAALKRAGRIATTRSTLPILSCVLLKAEPGGLTVSANNLDAALVLTLPCPDVVTAGSVAVCCSRLSAAVDRLSGSVLTLELRKAMLCVSGEGAEVRLATLPAEEFPETKGLKKATEFECEFEGLTSAVSRVLFACSTDATRFVLNGVLFDGASSRLVATDGRRLAAVELGQMAEKVLAIVPTAALKVLLSMPETERVSVKFGESMCSFSCDAWALTCKLIEGNFPNYEQVIPPVSERSVEVSRAALMKALPLMGSVLDAKSNSVLLVGIGEESLRLESNGADIGECEATVAAEVPEGFKAAFNMDFLGDVLGALRCDLVEIDMRDEMSPALFVSGDFTAVLMPLRIS